MPIIRSKAQLRWAHYAAKSGKGRTKKAAQDAIREFHGKTTRGMPERSKTSGRRRRRSRGTTSRRR